MDNADTGRDLRPSGDEGLCGGGVLCRANEKYYMKQIIKGQADQVITWVTI